MDGKNLEITKEFEELNDIGMNPKNPALDLDIENEVIDINEKMDSIEETIKGIDKLSDEIKDVKVKKKLKDKWKNLSKKKKIAIILIIILVIILIGIAIFFAIKLNDKTVDPEKKEDVIYVSDNYRYENGYLVLLDKNDEELGKYECKNKDEKSCFVSYYEIDEDLDEPQKIDEDSNLIETRSDIILDNYVFINDNSAKEDKIILYDIKNNENIEEYKGVKIIKDNYAIVKDYSESYGLLKFSENESSTLIDFNYDNMAMFSDENKSSIIVNESGRNYLIDFNEKALSKSITMNIVNYNSKYLIGIDDTKKYYLYDYKNNLVFDDSFDYIKLYDEYVLLIKDKKIYLNYYDGNKLNENGYDINLKYPYYQKTYVFDEDNKNIETYEPFSIVDNDTTITLKIDDKENVISKLEASISAATEYISYFDGVLYIYDNVDKTNLIGEYKCSNKNILTTTSTSFESCFIASDLAILDNDMTINTSSGMIPILNHRYVFIKDNPGAVTESNTNIVLYDLNKRKVISKYINVNTNLNTNLSKPSFITESNINIIAKNKSNKYGVITINSDSELASLIPFNYNSIENIGDYYLVSDSSGYSLTDKSGKELTKKISNKIRGYNNKYLKVYENNSYQIYDYNANKITTSGYKYVELYENYYAGVDSANKLNIYSYNEVSSGLLTESIQLSSNKYYGDGQVAFKVTISGTTANISTLKDNNYISSVYSLVPEIVNENQENNEEAGE